MLLKKTANVVVEKGHGRIGVREYHILPADNLAAQYPVWKCLKTLGAAIVIGWINREKSRSNTATISAQQN
ncbi:hypothetical protein ACLBW0_24505 [Enterobacteriaceae bacterium C34A]